MLGEQDAPQHPGVRRIVMSAVQPGGDQVGGGVRPPAGTRAASTLSMCPARSTWFRPSRPSCPMTPRCTSSGSRWRTPPRIAEWSKEVMESEWPAMNRTERGEGMEGAFPEYTAYVDAFVASLREAVAAGQAPEGLLTRLLTADVGGEQLSVRQMRALVFNLLLGGLTTTAQLLGNVIYQLLISDSVARLAAAERPGDRPSSRSVCASIPRSCSSLGVACRRRMVAGITVKPGERVIVGSACVNRDESLFGSSEQIRRRSRECGSPPHLRFRSAYLCGRRHGPFGGVDRPGRVPAFRHRAPRQPPGEVRL